MRVAILAYVLCAVSFADYSYAMDGNLLLEGCKISIGITQFEDYQKLNEKEILLAATCSAYLSGFVESAVFHKSLLKTGFSLICPPEGVTTEQLTRVAISFAEKYPEMLHRSASTVVGLALVEAFPCK